MFRSGFVAIVGRPNVGKSTLLNHIVGQKVAITSSVAQTTRHRIRGVFTQPDKGQLIFLDTPGFSKPLDTLGEYLVQESMAALEEADAFLMVVDAQEPPGKGDQWVLGHLKNTGKFILLVLNKVDTLNQKPDLRKTHLEAYKALLADYENHQVILASAQTGKNVSKIPDTLLRKMPEGPAYYEVDALTDQRLREMAAEIIREKVMRNTNDELPHSVAIALESFDETSRPGQTTIKATLYADQTSQKGILIGKNGQMIKQIGAQARQDMIKLMDHPVHLELFVKVKKNWRKDPQFLKSLGMAPPSH